MVAHQTPRAQRIYLHWRAYIYVNIYKFINVLHTYIGGRCIIRVRRSVSENRPRKNADRAASVGVCRSACVIAEGDREGPRFEKPDLTMVGVILFYFFVHRRTIAITFVQLRFTNVTTDVSHRTV